MVEKILWKEDFIVFKAVLHENVKKNQSCSIFEIKYILKFNSSNLIQWELRRVAYKVKPFLNDAFMVSQMVQW